MTQEQYEEIEQRLIQTAIDIAQAKRPAYTVGSPDVLANFKGVAARLGISPMQAWGTYFLKHVDAITAVAKNRAIPQAEPIKGRFADAINYLILGFAILEEQSGADAAPVGKGYQPPESGARISLDTGDSDSAGGSAPVQRAHKRR